MKYYTALLAELKRAVEVPLDPPTKATEATEATPVGGHAPSDCSVSLSGRAITKQRADGSGARIVFPDVPTEATEAPPDRGTCPSVSFVGSREVPRSAPKCLNENPPSFTREEATKPPEYPDERRSTVDQGDLIEAIDQRRIRCGKEVPFDDEIERLLKLGKLPLHANPRERLLTWAEMQAWADGFLCWSAMLQELNS